MILSTTDSLLIARKLAAIAIDHKAQNVAALDVRKLTSFTDAFVLITGTSDRHVRSVADAILEGSRSLNKERLGIEGYDEGRWILIDLNEVVMHIFQETVREEYDLERLWSDAVPITLENTDI